MGHPDLIDIRKAHGKTDRNGILILHHGIYLMTDISFRFLYLHQNIFCQRQFFCHSFFPFPFLPSLFVPRGFRFVNASLPSPGLPRYHRLQISFIRFTSALVISCREYLACSYKADIPMVLSLFSHSLAVSMSSRPFSSRERAAARSLRLYSFRIRSLPERASRMLPFFVLVFFSSSHFSRKSTASPSSIPQCRERSLLYFRIS